MTAAEIALLALRILLAAAFVGMGVAHFLPGPARGMRAMIPGALRRPGLPSPAALVALTGVCEIAGGLGLLAPWAPLRAAAGIALAVFLVAVFPANAVAARDPERFGRAAIPLVPRAIAQLLLIALVLLAGLAPV
ncbi:DoxX family protein [Homoserinibacter sp. YIM 151385]|uniref:DoxX family protein n=1 Tax=Homoserinibacter sp. YIM 151385 TaxID=2985506 RepID=UPI0022F0E95D|nr:DoxX family protein [Homoserinibacter sp. YIM 151385]WBU39277.1 DoxX family protein [Homoserinibacter sp. YIM 151385]